MLQKTVLELADAKRIAAAAADNARAEGWPMAIAITDEAGFLIYVERLDGGAAPSAQIAIAKARTAALYRVPTGILEQMVANRVALALVPDALTIEGGMPLQAQGAVVGGIGVSGMEAHQDVAVAIAGAAAL